MIDARIGCLPGLHGDSRNLLAKLAKILQEVHGIVVGNSSWHRGWTKKMQQEHPRKASSPTLQTHAQTEYRYEQI